MSIEESALNAGADSFLAKPVFASSLYNSLLSVTGIGKTVRTPGEMTQHPELAECRVLLAEDNELNREIAVELLRIREDVMKSDEAGMNRHLAKPIDPELLYQTLAEEAAKKRHS